MKPRAEARYDGSDSAETADDGDAESAVNHNASSQADYKDRAATQNNALRELAAERPALSERAGRFS